MSKVQIILEVVSNLTTLAESLKTYAEAMTEAEGFETIYTPEPEVKEQKEAPKPKAAASKKEQPAEETLLSRTDVRAKLADLARNGFGDDVKAILKKFGADRFSEIKDEDLNALMKEAEAVGS